MSTQEIAAQIEALKQQMAEAKKAESEADRTKAVEEAKAKAQLLLEETRKAADTLVEKAIDKGEGMFREALAKATVMVQRAEQGLTSEPANPSRPRRGRVLDDGRVMPLGRGKPSNAWKIVDLDTVDPSLIVSAVPPAPKATAVEPSAYTFASCQPTIDESETVTFVLKGSGQKPEIVPNES